MNKWRMLHQDNKVSICYNTQYGECYTIITVLYDKSSNKLYCETRIFSKDNIPLDNKQLTKELKKMVNKIKKEIK